MTKTDTSRREFVGSMAAAGTAFTIVPRHVLGGPGYTAPSDKLNIACIGVGGMGEADVKGVAGENIYALCDVDLKASEDTFRKYPAAKKYRDYREMLDQEQKNIDAVTITIALTCPKSGVLFGVTWRGTQRAIGGHGVRHEQRQVC